MTRTDRASHATHPSRRSMLGGTLALGCSLAASPLLTPITMAATPGEARLVVIVLRGAMDGLDLLRPVGAPELRRLRPRLGRADDADMLDDFHALHARLRGLRPMWQEGALGFVQAVSTPYRHRRSHFDGQDLLEAGTGEDVAPELRRSGWLNRALGRMSGVTAHTAFAVGRDEMRILEGPAPASRWTPGLRLDLSPQSQLLLERLYAGDPLFAGAADTALRLADGRAGLGYGAMLRMATRSAEEAAGSADDTAIAAYVARRLTEETRIAAFSLPGWDTHRDQHQTINRALGRLESTLLTLRSGLGPAWRHTAVLAMTEFGRTVRENGSGGTDHGTASALVFAGGALRGGRVHGDWPGLAESALFDDRDLMPTRDVRAHAAWLLHARFGLSRAELESTIFPGLEMGPESTILT